MKKHCITEQQQCLIMGIRSVHPKMSFCSCCWFWIVCQKTSFLTNKFGKSIHSFIHMHSFLISNEQFLFLEFCWKQYTFHSTLQLSNGPRDGISVSNANDQFAEFYTRISKYFKQPLKCLKLSKQAILFVFSSPSFSKIRESGAMIASRKILKTLTGYCTICPKVFACSALPYGIFVHCRFFFRNTAVYNSSSFLLDAMMEEALIKVA